MHTTALKEGFLGQKLVSLPKSTLSIAKKSKITENFYVCSLGHYPKANNHFRRRNKGSSDYIFIYCTKGKGEVIINSIKYFISPNEFFIIPKKTKHEYQADDSDPWTIYWFHFKGKTAKQLYNRYKLTDIKNYKVTPFSIEKIKLFEKIFNLFDHNNLEGQIEYANLLSLNFISSFVYQDIYLEINRSNNDNIINSVKKFLLDNLDKTFSLDEIAEKFNYSKSYLHTKFKSNTGYPIMVFFNLKKTQKACEYLNYTDLSIKEISYKIGFEDPLYFSRIFKNFMGKSPRNYKKSQIR
ncbi:AraC family transcriptional regulator [uncultured Polaribacter sp.]|uniref:AraC family transcriptional regulator n=1 Tax=uncultured Polaribacter sp. TaxID=174711 RepID=UPI00261C74AF|nr:AraC family transcriptional regulator [uncultured Polaribacter sp.]